MQNVCVFTGARPNFVKVAPIVRAIIKTEGIAYQLVYAGRQDDPTLEASLFDDLQMPKPDIYLGVDCENLNELTGRVMAEFENYLNHHSTDIVIVVDDLASTMAAAIVNKKSDRHWKGDTDKGKLSMSLFPYGVRTKNGDQNITFTISADDL